LVITITVINDNGYNEMEGHVTFVLTGFDSNLNNILTILLTFLITEYDKNETNVVNRFKVLVDKN